MIVYENGLTLFYFVIEIAYT